MSTPTTKTELLKSHLNELTKSHIEYDASNRPEYVYTVHSGATDGDPALVTRYAYDGLSSRVVYQKEYYSTWQSVWELF